jgi:hypothetical protein
MGVEVREPREDHGVREVEHLAGRPIDPRPRRRDAVADDGTAPGPSSPVAGQTTRPAWITRSNGASGACSDAGSSTIGAAPGSRGSGDSRSSPVVGCVTRGP